MECRLTVFTILRTLLWILLIRSFNLWLRNIQTNTQKEKLEVLKSFMINFLGSKFIKNDFCDKMWFEVFIKNQLLVNFHSQQPLEFAICDRLIACFYWIWFILLLTRRWYLSGFDFMLLSWNHFNKILDLWPLDFFAYIVRSDVIRIAYNIRVWYK